MSNISRCKFCEVEPQPEIMWDPTYLNPRTKKLAPLNPDGTAHQHIRKSDSTTTPATVKAITPINEAVPKKIESLNQINFAEVLSEILVDYIKLKRQEVGVGK
jgi:hypothetical protein